MTRSFELLQSHIASCSRIEPAKSLFIFISHNHLLKYVSHNVNRLGSVFKTVNLFLSLSLVTKQKPNMSCDLSDMDDGADSSKNVSSTSTTTPRTTPNRNHTLAYPRQQHVRHCEGFYANARRKTKIYHYWVSSERRRLDQMYTDIFCFS